MSEKNAFQDDPKVLDREYDEEENKVDAIDEENQRIDEVVKEVQAEEQSDRQKEAEAEASDEASSKAAEQTEEKKNTDHSYDMNAEEAPADAAEEQSDQQKDETKDASEEPSPKEEEQIQTEEKTDTDSSSDMKNDSKNAEEDSADTVSEHSESSEGAQPEEKTESENAENQPKTEPGQAEAILEGLLFLVGDEGITCQQASQVLGISEERAADLFHSLQQYYLDDSRGIELADYGGIYRFLSKGIVHPYAKTLFQLGRHSGLSQSALETLAIIAYKQPVTRVEIEEIRGVGADMMLRKLQARDLIRESGRSDAPGRPILYEVTDEFMNTFKLLSLKELPELPKFNDDDEEESDELYEK